MTSLRLTQRLMVTAVAAMGIMPVSQVQAQQEGPAYPYGWHMWDGGWHMIFGPLAMVVFLAAVIGAIVLLIRWLGGPSHAVHAAPRPPAPEPLDILRARFARGQIDKAEYDERRRVLEE